uniref:Cytochrome P450 n=1 Tax=Rhinopithecus bieti TaxID=61621 RepID=A0A2K6MQI5_RHIBE
MELDALVPLAVTVAIFLLLVDLMYRRQRWAARYPPGPLPLPGLGNLLHVDFKNTPYCFDQLRRRFGNVFSLQLAWTPVVVLNGLAAVREALVTYGEDTADRPPVPITQVLGFGPHSQGLFLARYGPAWREQRRFSVSTLRNLGLGKKSLEQWVTEEAAYLCAAFTDQAGRPFRPNSLLDKAVSNVIASLTYGRRFEYDDPRFLRLFDLTQEALKEESGLLREVLNAIPLLLRIPGMGGKVLRSQKALLTQLDELLTEHRMTWDPAQTPRDLTEAFLAEMEKVRAAATVGSKGGARASPGDFNEENLRMVVSDLFSAGMVRGWSPECCHCGDACLSRRVNGIDDVIGQGAATEMCDQARMPYTLPVQRFGCIVPLMLPHMTSRDIEGTTLFTNLSSVLKDEAVWEKPSNLEGSCPGARLTEPSPPQAACMLGGPLARHGSSSLLFTCLAGRQRFSFSVPAGQPRPSHHGVFAFLVTPSPYELCAVPR